MVQTFSSKLKAQIKAFRYIPQLFILIWRINGRLLFINIILRLLRSVLPVVTLFIGKEILDEIVRLVKVFQEFQLSHTQSIYELIVKTPENIYPYGTEGVRLWTLIALELGIVLLSEIITRSINLTESLLVDLFSNYTSIEIIKQAATLDLSQFETPEFYDTLERARNHTASRATLMTQVFEQCQDIITVLTLGAGFIYLKAWLIVVIVIALLPALIGELYFNQRIHALIWGWTPQRRVLNYIQEIGSSNETAKEIKVFGLAHFLSDKYQNIADRYYQENKKMLVKRTIWGVFLNFISSLAYYVAYFSILTQTISSVISLGTMAFLARSFERMRGMIQSIMLRFSTIGSSALYLQDYFDFMALKPMITKTGKQPVTMPIKQGFSFENVSFQYPNSNKYAVKNLSFKLNVGEKLALVGENGSGKTTIVKLLTQLYVPTEGVIKLDGIPLSEYNAQELCEIVSLIFQDYNRFQMLASENIATGDIKKREEQAIIEKAAQKSLADTVIEKLPLKYAQMLGKKFNNGIELSGGQWQKIALARAYMREAQLLILDEPTAALDALAEYEIFLRFSDLIQGKMAVLISHRFSTVRMADRILYLENGTLQELGTHEELMAINGKYAALFNLQAKGYV